MLIPRILTALALLAVLLPALFAAGPTPFLALMLAFIAAAAWEWARLNQWPGLPAVASGLLCAALCAALWWCGALTQDWGPLWLLAGAAWVLGGAWLLARGVPGWPRLPRPLRWALGMALLVLAWLALAHARMLGVNFLLSVLTLVWVADVFAYFAGRALGGKLTGGRKLAATISPGKSWEGVAGGVLGVLLLAAIWIAADAANAPASASLYTRLWQAGAPWLLLGVLLLAGMSVVGDLIESLVKRSAGMKDSSHLLPGHGGVLDRIDAQLPTLPLALALLWLCEKGAAV